MNEFVIWLKDATNFRFDVLWEYRGMFWTGILFTLGLTAFAVLGGTILGLLGAFARIIHIEKGGWAVRLITQILRQIAGLYVALFRGTPLFVQLIIWHFVWSPALIHPNDGWLISGDLAAELRRNYGALISGVLALTFNAGAYITEIFRAGIQSIDKGQMEAARSLGLSYAQAMRFVILPQALRRMLPPIANEFITLLKDSSLLSAIAVAELTYVYKAIVGHHSIYAEPLYTIALLYLLMTLCLSWLFTKLEKKYNPQNHH